MTSINEEKHAFVLESERANVDGAVDRMKSDLKRVQGYIEDLLEELDRAKGAARAEDEEPRICEKIVSRQADCVCERLNAVRHSLNNVNRYEGQFAGAMARVAGMHAMRRFTND